MRLARVVSFVRILLGEVAGCAAGRHCHVAIAGETVMVSASRQRPDLVTASTGELDVVQH
eukprot:6204818-Pleurochrysis_carterae.AAC.3